MKPVILHPEALEEFNAAAARYAKIDPTLGQSFYNIIDRLIAVACTLPRTFRFYCKPARRHFTRQFPYGIIYLERPEDIWVVAVMPLRRKPGYWQHRSALEFPLRILCALACGTVWLIPPDFTVPSSSLHTPPAPWVDMKTPVTNLVMALGLGAIGVAIGAAGITIGDTDDAPGAALLGILLMIGLVALGVRTARRETSRHPERT